ncbi:hypothetical protein C343_05579 [Cryptococcus neoformans C23]|uniref:Uncharacterized protein n=2 Tax=Cryptococcus neoformans TaxID=5207 RepID=A0A854QCF8_CRYNE|nr:hypothetical protein CNAG_07849 [Cryptococcus neoformans var. grubii H99]AUB27461.1 hypothetical protein CKF44_07849 [Cryptococcus neoformans var. grubii]OWZ40358.1 hypothetical protein C343_05579 [Cryptococcus neoformans var. grubii C23]OXC82431.1 hypothetical protein C344_05301 [Cryptococcus neoformans var. grubii AD1-7a]OXG13692.1 hypothetical protein C361_05832 [Cryptococcus neoformans var. grubii Tu259-1]OXG28013.1 hypothetical protein C360_05951 [Cryptococcus neoformans var. grubii Bt|eukprot:XP_012051962.1 hypothetical protein CNAG_07849 [Cryptococcus neoformans var. grubii H99]
MIANEDEGCLKGPGPLQSLTDSSSHGHGGRGLNKKHEFHKEYKELKMTTLSLERERLAGDKARRDWEEQALEEHRRTERRMKEEEMECRQKEVSARKARRFLRLHASPWLLCTSPRTPLPAYTWWQLDVVLNPASAMMHSFAEKYCSCFWNIFKLPWMQLADPGKPIWARRKRQRSSAMTNTMHFEVNMRVVHDSATIGDLVMLLEPMRYATPLSFIRSVDEPLCILDNGGHGTVTPFLNSTNYLSQASAPAFADGASFSFPPVSSH